VAIPVRAVEFPKNKKKKVNNFGNCIFHVYAEQTPLNRLLSFLAHRVTSPTLSIAKFLIDRSRDLRWGGGPKIACSHRKAESSIILHCTTVHAVIMWGATAQPIAIIFGQLRDLLNVVNRENFVSIG
jgi:hypothetical protein